MARVGDEVVAVAVSVGLGDAEAESEGFVEEGDFGELSAALGGVFAVEGGGAGSGRERGGERVSGERFLGETLVASGPVAAGFLTFAEKEMAQAGACANVYLIYSEYSEYQIGRGDLDIFAILFLEWNQRNRRKRREKGA